MKIDEAITCANLKSIVCRLRRTAKQYHCVTNKCPNLQTTGESNSGGRLSPFCPVPLEYGG